MTGEEVSAFLKEANGMRAERDAALAEVQRLREALTPSAETKVAYSGEFSIYLEEIDEHGDSQTREVPVPWTTIKAIMATICARALVSPP